MTKGNKRSEIILFFMFVVAFTLSIAMVISGGLLFGFIVETLEGNGAPLWYAVVGVVGVFGLRPAMERLYVRIVIMQGQVHAL